MAVLGLLAFAAQAQVMMGISGPLNIALVGQVQQEETVISTPGGGHISLASASTTKFRINTKSLLKLIAADQDLTLPPKAKLWLSGNSFYILRQDNTIFTNIDSELLSITYVTNVLAYKTIQKTNSYASTVTETLIAILDYNGSSISFSLNCYGKNTFYNATDFTNAIAVNSYSGPAFGSGTSGDQNMIVKGSLKGKHTTRYAVGGGGVGTFPPPNNPSGEFPGSQVP
jgi:hypothetical protein